jgi:hypothetical protein
MLKKSRPPKIEKFPASKQRRLDQLLEKNSEGAITPRETASLERLVAEAQRLMVANAKRLAGSGGRSGKSTAAGAVFRGRG